jgi:hypothetical protein
MGYGRDAKPKSRVMTGTPSNRKPADRLADIREQIRVLEAEEELLRQGFIAGTLDQQGDEYTVAVGSKVNERIAYLKNRKPPTLRTSRVFKSKWSPRPTPGRQAGTQKEGIFRVLCI